MSSAPVKRDVHNPQDGLAKKRRKGATRLRSVSFYFILFLKKTTNQSNVFGPGTLSLSLKYTV
jgi:hypothetical protein